MGGTIGRCALVTWTYGEHFAGLGGVTQGVARVVGIDPRWAANHNKTCMASHEANFPDLQHFCEDITKLKYGKFPPAELVHFSPCCPPFTNARGERQHFDIDSQGVLFEDELGAVVRDEVRLGRILMHEVHRYIEAMALRGRPVLAGTVENVIEARKWGAWRSWLQRFHVNGYKTRVIAINSMHLNPIETKRPPQSRDRLLVMFWPASIGRDPDVEKWLLRPRAWCSGCEQWVNAMQVFKDLSNDMGRYGIRYGQYVYRCPHRSCRNHIVEPPVLGAEHAIDLDNPGTVIGARKIPLRPATRSRIRRGIKTHWAPLLVPSGGTWRDKATPLAEPMPARTTRETDGVVLPPFITVLRNNATTKLASEPLTTITTSGAHHGLVTAPAMLVPYYTTGRARLVTSPMGALSTHDRYGIAACPDTGLTQADIDALIDALTYRMMTVPESANGMGFEDDYVICGDTVEVKTRQIGQAVTPALGENSYRAIVEMLSGEETDPAPWPDQMAAA